MRTVHPPLLCIACALTLFVASTDATAIAEGTSDTRATRHNSLSTETLETLEKRLAQRPDRQELQDRNILKGAPVRSELEHRF